MFTQLTIDDKPILMNMTLVLWIGAIPAEENRRGSRLYTSANDFVVVDQTFPEIMMRLGIESR